MKETSWKSYVGWVLLTEAVGAAAGFLTREGTQLYKTSVIKPPLSPPAAVFPVAWAILYALMGIGMARVSLAPESEMRRRCRRLYLLQLAFNFFWSILFFNFEAFGAAFVWLVILWVLILWMMRSFGRVDPLSGRLQIPYLAWVAFAGYLNLGVWLLNR